MEELSCKMKEFLMKKVVKIIVILYDASILLPFLFVVQGLLPIENAWIESVMINISPTYAPNGFAAFCRLILCGIFIWGPIGLLCGYHSEFRKRKARETLDWILEGMFFAIVAIIIIGIGLLIF